MTVKELKEILNRYQDDTKVLVDGYEDGYNEIDDVSFETVVPNTNPSWYEGKYSHERYWKGYHEATQYFRENNFNALIISRKNP
jgi:hypothetical protein